MDSKVVQEIAKNLTDDRPLSEKEWEELLSTGDFITLRGNKRLYSVTVVPNPKSSGTYGIEDIDFIDIFTTDKETFKIIELELDFNNVAKFINPEFRERKNEMKLTP